MAQLLSICRDTVYRLIQRGDLAAQTYAATGAARIVVDQPEVDRWFPNESASMRRALLELYRLDWSGGHAPLASGGFWSDLSLERVRLIDAVSGWDFLNRAAGRGHFDGDTESSKRELLRAVYERWRETNQWPTLRDLVLASAAEAVRARAIEQAVA